MQRDSLDGMPAMPALRKRDRYLFVRALEACNADCFMCGFAMSKDLHRFTVPNMSALAEEAFRAGVRYVRFTGGEPLMHSQIGSLIAAARGQGHSTSLITNGMLLPKRLSMLLNAGLDHLIVSLDGATAQEHDSLRGTRGCFVHALEGLADAIRSGIITRVNTVVGPHNYRSLPALRDLLADLGVAQWEVSTIKLPEMPHYDDVESVRAVGDDLYGQRSRLKPLGKRWYGDTQAERDLFFIYGVPPRASAPRCHVVDDVMFFDTKSCSLYACSCLPHSEPDSGFVQPRHEDGFGLESPQFAAIRDYWAANGPTRCTGCTSTPAAYSDLVATGSQCGRWAY
jgi:cytosylglucuronate decarboxylase